MTAPRKAITLATKVAVLQSQAVCGCGCGAPLKGEAIQYDHCLAHALEGSDGPENIRAVLADCHDRITNGTRATTAGSTKQVVAKVKRIRKKRQTLLEKFEEAAREPVPDYGCKMKPRRKILSLKFPAAPPGYRHFPAGRKVGQ